MTLTTEQLRARAKFWREKAVEAKWESVSIAQDMLQNADAFDELAANREAQPVPGGEYGDAYQGAREDLVIWKRRALEAEDKVRHLERVNDHLVKEAQGEHRIGEPVFTAPPAPAVPPEKKLPELMMASYHEAIGWNACRAAMLNHSGDANEKVEPVSQHYKLPPHVYRELVNSLRDTAMKYQGMGQLREQLSRTLSDAGLLAAAPEGGK